MADFPSLPLFTDAYIADTMHMSCLESGAYLHLLMAAWRAPDCALPSDEKMLARMARCTSREWEKVRDVVMDFWVFDEAIQKWTQKRLLREREFVREKSGKASAAAQARWQKINDSSHANAGHKHVPGPCEVDAPTPIPTPKKETAPNGAAKKAPCADDADFEMFWGQFPKKRAGSKQKAWSAWKQARQRASAEEILAGAVRYVESDEVARGYAKGAAAWLNDDRWAVDYTPPRNGSGPGPPLPVTRSGLSPTLEREFHEFQSTNGQARGEDDCDSAVGNPRLPAPTESN